MEYSVTMSNATIALTPVTKAFSVFINPAAAPKPNLNFMRMWMSQSSTATSAQLCVLIQSVTTAFGTYTSTTPVGLKAAGPASNITGNTTGAAGSSGTNASVAATGTLTTYISEHFNNLNGYLWVASQKETIVMPAGSTAGLGIGLITTPSSLNNWSAGMVYSEE
jgi:hypothetical protein